MNAETGNELWKTGVADIANGETITMASLVVGDRVLVGPSGGEFGIHGWLKGLDLETGAVVWIASNMCPDARVLATPDTFKAFYDESENLAFNGWPDDAWQRGGAPVWGCLTYDPALDLVYHGNPGPFSPLFRGLSIDLNHVLH